MTFCGRRKSDGPKGKRPGCQLPYPGPAELEAVNNEAPALTGA